VTDVVAEGDDVIVCRSSGFTTNVEASKSFLDFT